MSPYQRAKADIGRPGGPPGGPPGGLPSGPGPQRNSPAPSAGSGNPYASNQGYGSDRYGSSGGYGGDRYGHNASAYASNQGPSNVTPSQSGRSGGYGGFGPRDDNPSASESNDLFGGAKGRVPPGQNPYGNNPYAARRPDPNLANNPYANPSTSQSGNTPDYGSSDYANENLSPEEQEEREYRQVKAQVKQQRADNLSSTQRSLAMTERIIETGSGTLAHLGQQSERLHRTEQNLNMASVHAKTAEDKTKELKTLNRSMFAVHVGNPFTKSKRQAEAEQAAVDRSNSERRQREETRAGNYQSNQRMEATFNEIEEMRAKQKTDYNKYDMTDSEEGELSDDEAMMKTQEKQNLVAMSNNLHIIKRIAQKQGEEVDRQNKHIDQIMARTDGVHDHVVRNDAKLRTIK